MKLLEKYGLFINGEWRDAKDGATLDAKNPANGEHLAKIADATEEDVNDAVRAAREAFNKFRHTTVSERAKLLNKIADIIDEHKEHLAKVESMDNGKPIRETLNVDIPFAAEHFRYFAGVIMGEEGSANVLDEKQLSIVLREPIGVVGQIVPWNFPFLMAAWKLAPVIAAGDASVFKPSSETSLSVLELFRLIDKILPKGLINIVTGRGSKSGEWIKNHPGLDKLAFTGSTEIGRDIAIAAARRIIPATLELGGKSANIFFSDANLDKALDGLQLGILFNQGQVCCAGSRIFVEESFYDNFIEAAVKVGACDTVIPATDTIVESLDGEKISSIPDRSKVYQGQTPQSFRAKRLKELYSSLTDEEKAILTDAAKIYLLKGEAVHLVRGEVFNIKITYPYDLTVAETLINTDRE